MTEDSHQKFVGAFAAAWASRDGAAFLKLWHPHGLLYYPFANRVIKGSELGMLTDFQNKGAPHLTWKLLGWTSRDNIVIIEWESSNRYGEQVLTWRGVDRITLEGGKIIEETVYADTAPLQARRHGLTFDALLQLPD
jgi:SnoaL-like domain